METVFNGTKGRASFAWDLRAPRFYAIVLLTGKALHIPLINGFCKAFVKGRKLQALQDCSPGLETTTQPGSGPSRARCRQQKHDFINTLRLRVLASVGFSWQLYASVSIKLSAITFTIPKDIWDCFPRAHFA